MKVFVLTDNQYIFEHFYELSQQSEHDYHFYYSYGNQTFRREYGNTEKLRPIDLKKEEISFFDRFDVFFSLHSKQIFPDRLVSHYRCINVHPGLNPYNRGWFPQVFSIVNGLPAGVTIHEMDNQLDHGNIIFQSEIQIQEHETSWDVYQRILKLEIDMLREKLEQLVTGEYLSRPMECEGNLNYKQDFDRLCQIDMDEISTFHTFYNRLRATTFSGYDNAYFIDKDGAKVYLSIQIKRVP